MKQRSSFEVGYPLALVVVTSLFFFVFKWIFGPRSEPLLCLFTWLFESAIFFWIALLDRGLSGVCPLRKTGLRAIVFGGLFALFYVSQFFHDLYFVEAAERRFTVLDFAPESIRFFVVQVVPPADWLLFAAVTGGLLLLALPLRRLTFAIRPGLSISALGVATAAGVGFAFVVPAFPSPLADLGADALELLQKPAVPDDGPIDWDLLAAQNRSVCQDEQVHPRFKKILVFVMESVTEKWLAEDSAKLGPETFFHRERAHARRVRDFFASDQDSRTGLLALLGGRHIPFEAYTEEGLDHYWRLRFEPTLVDVMNASGYTTALAASETEEELIVWDLPWQERIHLSPAEFEGARAEGLWACLNPYEFEHSCEDKILLPRLFDLIDRNERVFLFHELIFGHAGEYHDLTGKSTVGYYSELLDAMMAHIRSRGLEDETLVVVTSDHGIRDREYETRLSAYRIPLWFIHPSFESEEIDGLYGSIHFLDLLFATLEDRPKPPPAKAVLVNGSTQSALIGAVTKALDLVLLKNRYLRSYVFSSGNYREGEERPSGPALCPLDPAVLLSTYRVLQGAFAAPGCP